MSDPNAYDPRHDDDANPQNPQNTNQSYGQPYNPQYRQNQYGQYQNNPYQQNPQNPYGNVPPYMQYRQYNQHPDRWNGMAIAGFVCSFFIAILGLIFSILGLVKINKTKEKGRGLAIAGIVISLASMIFAFTTLAGSFDEFVSSSVSSPSVSASATSSSSAQPKKTTSNNGDILTQYTEQLEDLLDDDAANNTYSNVEQLVQSDMFQQQLQKVTNSLPGDVTADVTANGNTVTTMLTVANDYEGQVKSMIDKLSSQQTHDALQDLADSMDELCGDAGNTVLNLTIRTDGGTNLFDQTATADND